MSSSPPPWHPGRRRIHPSPLSQRLNPRLALLLPPLPIPHRRHRTRTLLTISALSALLSALCAGSITIFSLYGHIFQSRLHYTQFEVNGLASAASIAMYVPVPLLGYFCDRSGPAPLSLLAAVLFGGGYAAAAGAAENGYGTVTERTDPFNDLEDPNHKDPQDEEEARFMKQTVLNAETRRFLTDHTMWCFALGFFFMIGPGEAFINNMGTVIKTLYPHPSLHRQTHLPATHVSIVGLTSTAVRLLTGTLTDLLAPSPKTRHINSPHHPSPYQTPLYIPPSGLIQNHGSRFWLVSGLVGAGYGAVFSLTPIIITVIWGVENFATNWGIVAMFPALGATLWGTVYSAVYQRGVGEDG
ncbi:hypothetical protein N0V88_000441 [Collariella sp. IMI 366227]|nr:hypothetical protein N0V88_000441 [Collariella sp. IMI 366227]